MFNSLQLGKCTLKQWVTSSYPNTRGLTAFYSLVSSMQRQSWATDCHSDSQAISTFSSRGPKNNRRSLLYCTIAVYWANSGPCPKKILHASVSSHWETGSWKVLMEKKREYPKIWDLVFALIVIFIDFPDL